MSSKLRLSLACGDYEITRPLIDGRVKPAGIELVGRHAGIARAPLAGRARPRLRHLRVQHAGLFHGPRPRLALHGAAGLSAPALPPRLPVRQQRRRDSREPKDLIGKRIAGTNYSPASNIWMRGILEEFYGLPHQSVTWVTERDEDIAVRSAARAEDREDAEGRPSLEDTRGVGRARRAADAVAAQAVHGRQSEHQAAVRRLPRGRDRLLEQDRHLPDHARHDHPRGDRQGASLGRAVAWRAPSTRPRRWPMRACAIRAPCPLAWSQRLLGRAAGRCSAAIRGNTGSGRRNRKNLETIAALHASCRA